MENNVTMVNNEKTEIRIQPEPFHWNVKTEITTSMKLADKISSFFAGIFKDYSGCQIRINDGHGYPSAMQYIPSGAVYVNLYFSTKYEINNTGELFAIATKEMKTVDPRVNWENNRNVPKKEQLCAPTSSYLNLTSIYSNSNAFEISKDMKDILAKYTFEGEDNVRWTDHLFEEITSIGVYDSGTETVLNVSGIDINKIIADIYGINNGEKRYDYSVNPSTIIPNRAGEFIVQISQLDTRVVRELQNALGVFNNNGANYHRYYGNR